MILTGFDDEIEQTCRRAYLRNSKGLDCEKADNDCDNEGVKVIGQEGCLDTTDESVENNANRKQKRRRNNMHPGTKFIIY